MGHKPAIPTSSYGILQRNVLNSTYEEAAEQVRRLGYAVIDSELSESQIAEIADAFDSVDQKYKFEWGQEYLESINEHDTIRLPLIYDRLFLSLALNKALHEVVSLLIPGMYVLNQQNGVINPVGRSYNQGAWHRDLPYQHFVSDVPLAINALFCVDDFTLENGATHVIPFSHKTASFPSDKFVEVNSTQVIARRGMFIVLDCMLFHAGGVNISKNPRRAVNHVFTIPNFRQQICIERCIDVKSLSAREQILLGISNAEPQSIEDFFNRRTAKRHG